MLHTTTETAGWSWQTYWLSQAFICWFVAPIIGAILTIPELGQVLSEAPKDAMLITFGLGAAYGIGGTCFGLAIRHIGYSLTYAIAIGLSSVLGTLTGPILKNELGDILDKPGGEWVLAGVLIGVLGTLMCGFAGRLKEKEQDNDKNEQGSFSLTKGLTLSVVAGILSAVYGIAIGYTSEPIIKIAENHGAGEWQGNIAYVFANTGAFLTTAIYTIWLSRREKTFHEFVPGANLKPKVLAANYLLALLTGCMWYSQFLFYGLGHVRMGEHKFSSWAIHMTMLILFSSLLGIFMKEWRMCRPRTKMSITAALVVLLGAVSIISYGNYIAEEAKIGKAVEQKQIVNQVDDSVAH